MNTVEVTVMDMEALRVLCSIGIVATGVLWWIMERLASDDHGKPQ